MCCIFGYAIRIYIFTALIFIQLIPHYIVIILMQRALDCNYVPRTNNLRFMFGYVAYFYRSKCINLTEIRFPIGYISPAPDHFLLYHDHFTSTPPGTPSKYTWYIRVTEQHIPKDDLIVQVLGRKKRKVLLQTTPGLDQIVFKKLSNNSPVRPILNFGNEVPQEPKFIRKSMTDTRKISNGTLEKLMEGGNLVELPELMFNSTGKVFQKLKASRKSTTPSLLRTRENLQEVSNDTLRKLMEEIFMEDGGIILDDEIAGLILNLTGRFPNTTPSYPQAYNAFQNIPNGTLEKLMEDLLMEESENIPKFLEKMIHSSGNKKEIPLFPIGSANFPTKHYLVHLTHNYGRTGYVDPELETESTIGESLKDTRRIFITKNFGKYHDFRKRPQISTGASTYDDARKKILEKDRRIFVTKDFGKNYDFRKRPQISTEASTYVDPKKEFLEKDRRIFITKDLEKHDQERSTGIPEEHTIPKGLAKPKVPFKFPTRGLNITNDQELLKHILGNLKNLETDFWDEDKIEFVLGILDPINWILYFLAMMTDELPPNSLVTMLTQDPYVRWPDWVIFNATFPPKSRHAKIKEGRRNVTLKPKFEGHNYNLRQWITYRGREWPEWWDNHTTQGWIKIQELEPTAIMWPLETPQYGWVRDWVTIWLLMDLLWAIVTCVLLGGAIGRVRGASSIFTYFPFILVTFCIIVMDLACAAFFAVSIPNCANFWSYLTFVGVRNVGQLKDPEKVWFPDYKNSFADAPWFLACFFLRGIIFWIINVIIFFKVVHIFRRVLAKTCNLKEVFHRIMVRRRTKVPCIVTSNPQSNFWSSTMVLPPMLKSPTPVPTVSQVLVPRSSGAICRPPTPTICCRPFTPPICYRPCIPPCYGRSEDDEKEDEPCTPATCPNYRPPSPPTPCPIVCRPPTPPICYRPCTPPPCYGKPSEDTCTPATSPRYRPPTPPNPRPYPGSNQRYVCQPPVRPICQPCPPCKPRICKKCKTPKKKVPSTPDCCTPSTCPNYRPPTPPNPCPYPGGSQQYCCRPCPTPPREPCIPKSASDCNYRPPTPPYPGGSQQYVCRPCPQPTRQPCPPNPCFGSQPSILTSQYRPSTPPNPCPYPVRPYLQPLPQLCPPNPCFGGQVSRSPTPSQLEAQQCVPRIQSPVVTPRPSTPSGTQSAGLFPRKSALGFFDFFKF